MTSDGTGRLFHTCEATVHYLLLTARNDWWAGGTAYDIIDECEMSAIVQVSHCKLPCLAIALTLRHDRQAELSEKSSSSSVGVSGVVAFVCGLLLDSDTTVRNWFSLCIRNGLKVGNLSAVRLFGSICFIICKTLWQHMFQLLLLTFLTQPKIYSCMKTCSHVLNGML